MAWFPLRLEEVRAETPIDRTLVWAPVAPADATALVWQPGQFLLLRDPTSGIAGQRAYSLSVADDGAARPAITVRDMGRYGAWWFRRAAGHVAEGSAPRGRFVMDLDSCDRMVLLAAGSGVAPFRAFLEAWERAGRPMPLVLLQSARVPAELVFAQRFAEAAGHPAFTWQPTVTRAADDDTWQGRRGRIDAAWISSALGTAQAPRVYACGPDAFVEAALAGARAAGVPDERLHHEAWG